MPNNDNDSFSMQVPFVDLTAQHQALQDELQEAIQQVMQQSAYSSGPFVETFEEQFAGYCGTEYAVGVNSGTSALHLALRALNIGPGDEVITVPNTFISTVWAIIYTGAKPVFVDVEPQYYTMDMEELEEVITPHTKAIIPVHLYGHPVNMTRVNMLARQHQLSVIEDAAQAHGARWKNRSCGTWGQLGCFSFYPAKNLGAMGEAGAVITDDPTLAQRLRKLRDHAQPEKYVHEEIGYNYRMDGLQGAVLETKLKYVEQWTERRRAIAHHYNQRLGDLPGITIPMEHDRARHVYHLYELQLETHPLRDKLRAYLDEQQIATGLHYPIPVHLQPALEPYGYSNGDFPVTESLAKRLLSLPIYPEMSIEQIDYVADHIRRFITG
ncbi:MAG: DegT/DnrJ/EryC1/StrS family aminotransferase [Bacteroidota bacterium]